MELINKPTVVRGTLSVKQKIYLTPHYIRIILEGEDLKLFSGVSVGANNKIFIPSKESGQPMVRRTYTLRALDLKAGEMFVDFVAHGDEGPASGWAMKAQPGDILEVAMKDRSKALFPAAAAWFLLAGDHTALPVISVILETLPATAEGIAIIHVTAQEDILSINTSSRVKISWIIGDQHEDLLSVAVRSIPLPSTENKFVFAAAETNTISNLRNYFKEAGITKEQLSAYAYWKFGNSEDNSEMERRNEAK